MLKHSFERVGFWRLLATGMAVAFAVHVLLRLFPGLSWLGQGTKSPWSGLMFLVAYVFLFLPLLAIAGKGERLVRRRVHPPGRAAASLAVQIAAYAAYFFVFGRLVRR